MGRRTTGVDVAPAFVTGTKACAEGADVDGDASPTPATRTRWTARARTPTATASRNDTDNCPLVANPAQTDTDDDLEGDACDPDQGADRAATTFRNARHARRRYRERAAQRGGPRRGRRPRRRRVGSRPAGAAPISGYRVSAGGRSVDVGAQARSAALDGLPEGPVRISVQALSDGAAGASALSEPVRISAAPVATATPTPTPQTPAATPTPAPPTATPAPTPVAKPTISFKGAAKKLKLDRRGRFTLRFKATPKLRGTFTVAAVKKGAMKTLKGKFAADSKGVVKLTLKPGKRRGRSVKLRVTVVAGPARATHSFTLR